MADGLLNLQNELEGEAEKCLQDLIDRCLVLFSEKSLDETKISTCYVHDLIYDLFLREVQRGNIFTTNDIVFDNSDANHDRSKCQSLSRHKLHPFKSFTGDEIHDFPYGFYSTCQLRDPGNNDLLKRTHSIRISGGYFSTLILKSVLIHFKLLKLLDLSHMRIVSFPLQIVSLIWLRYLALHCGKNFDIPPEICRLWNLQTFIVEGNRQTDMQTFIVERIRRSVITFPKEIWGLMQLRHLKVDRFILPNPPSVSVDRVRHLDFSNIQTISYLSPHCCTKEVISEIQNVKKLGIYGNQDDYKMIIPSAKSFPATLKKLKLKSTYLSWLYLDIIAELPNLEVLELMDYACCGKEWHPIVRGFTRLKLLLIEENDLRYWKATDDNFPVLERLVLKECSYLKEMPIEFADIHSLQLIMLTSCLPELGESAARIQK
ncbi:putative late blight resistance protein R1B-8 [Capsicum chacoense]